MPPTWQGTRTVPCIPKAMWDSLIHLAHTTGGHAGRDLTTQRLARSVFFPGIKREVEGYIKGCRDCQMKTQQQTDQRHTLVSVPCGYPFQKIHIDLVGRLTPSRRSGACWILTVRDAFSKWVEAFPLIKTTTEDIARVLEKEIFARFGYPDVIHSDQGPQFTSQFFKDLTATLGIQVTDTTGYNPKSNGIVERFHRDLGSSLRALIKDDPDSWEDVLPQALFAIRTNVCRSTGLAPYQILFGRDCSTPLELIFGNPDQNDPIQQGERSYHDYLRRLRRRIDVAQSYARRNLAAAVVRQRRAYHQEKQSFAIGAKVWLFTPRSKRDQARKFAKYWSGPWVVCGNNGLVYRIAPCPSWKDHGFNPGSRVVVIDRLKPFYGDKPQPPTPDDDIDMEGDEFAEAVDPMAPPPSPPPAPDQPPGPPYGGGPQPPGGGGGPPPPGGGGGDADDDDDAPPPQQQPPPRQVTPGRGRARRGRGRPRGTGPRTGARRDADDSYRDSDAFQTPEGDSPPA